jgi:hypothetical protein
MHRARLSSGQTYGGMRFIELRELPAPQELAKWFVAAANTKGAIICITTNITDAPKVFRTYLIEARRAYIQPMVGLTIVPQHEMGAIIVVVEPNSREDVHLVIGGDRVERWVIEENRPVLRPIADH